MTKTKWIIAAIAALVVILVACAMPYFFIGAPAEGVVKVRKGSTIDMISDSVQAHVDVTFGKRVATMMNLMRAKVENREGAYRITPGMSAFTAARRIKNGVQDGVRFTFNNVRTVDEWIQRWGDSFMAGPDEMRKALNDTTLYAKYGKTKETIACLLMSDTYEFYWNITPEKMLDRMFDYYNQFWNEERKAKAQRLGLSPDQVATIASIVGAGSAYTGAERSFNAAAELRKRAGLGKLACAADHIGRNGGFGGDAERTAEHGVYAAFRAVQIGVRGEHRYIRPDQLPHGGGQRVGRSYLFYCVKEQRMVRDNKPARKALCLLDNGKRRVKRHENA